MNVGSMRLALASAVGGAALIFGALFVGGAFVSAQEPAPTPGAEQQQTAPEDGNRTPKSKEDCEREKAEGSSSGSSTRGSRTDYSRNF